MKLKDTTAAKSYQYGWLLSKIFPFIKPFLGRVILGFLLAIPVGLLDGVTAFAIKPYMDYVIGKKDLIIHSFSTFHGYLTFPDFHFSYLKLAAIIPFCIVFFAGFQGVLRYLNDYLTDWTSQKITNSVKMDLFAKLVYMDTSFFDHNTSGMVLTRYLSDPETASRSVVDNIKTIIMSIFGALGLIAVMLYSSWRLATIGVAVLLIAFAPILLIRKKIKQTSNQGMVIGGNITTNFNETYAGNKVMTAYDLQKRQINNFNELIDESFYVNISLIKRAAWMSPLMYLIASVGIAIVIWYGTKLIIDGQMTAGSFASFIMSLILLYKPVRALGNNLTKIQGIFVAMGRVFELFDYEPKIKNKENTLTLSELNSSIEFQNVDFEYESERPVLKELNLKVQKGETIAIVGNSGGGKSTLVNLLPRFYDVKSGAIKFDGTDIREYSLASLRNNMAMVFQDNFLFTGSIKENILMGNPNASDNDINEVIQAAHLQEMLADMPNGIDTILGERGTTLSGGQRQRVAIARAMIKKAPIIILDEATSALDNKSEAIVQKALDNLMQNKTVFVIAHRLSTIKNADRIAVLNSGSLVELGSHDELMNIENGHYKHLYEMQFSKAEEPKEDVLV